MMNYRDQEDEEVLEQQELLQTQTLKEVDLAHLSEPIEEGAGPKSKKRTTPSKPIATEPASKRPKKTVVVDLTEPAGGPKVGSSARMRDGSGDLVLAPGDELLKTLADPVISKVHLGPEVAYNRVGKMVAELATVVCQLGTFGEGSQGESTRWHKIYEAQKAEIALLKKKLVEAEVAREAAKVEVEGLKTEAVTLRERNFALDLENFDLKTQNGELDEKVKGLEVDDGFLLTTFHRQCIGSV